MSFPNLVLTGSIAERYIDSITLKYENVFAQSTFNTLTRLSYKVTKELKNNNSNSGVGNRKPDLKYDYCRLNHKWIGYCDVNTESVCLGDNSGSQSVLNMGLIENAIFYYTGTTGTEGITYNYDATPILEQGPKEPNIDTSEDTAFYEIGDQRANSWWIGYGENNEGYTTKNWLITGIGVDDNGNNTTRVTFNFSYISPWYSLEDIDRGIGAV